MKKFTLFLAMVLMVTIGFSGNALALTLDVATEAQISRHIEGEYEWVLAWNSSIYGDPDKVKMKGFKFDRNRGTNGIDKPDTSGLYQEDTSVMYIRNDKKKMKKWLKKAVKLDLTDEQTFDFINGKFAAKTKGWGIKAKADGEVLKAKVLFGKEYNNPDDGADDGGIIIGDYEEDNGTPSHSVPEPATLFLLGVGLMGLGAIRRTRIKSVQ